MSQSDEPTTMCEAFHRTVARRPGEVALREAGGGATYTWAEYAERTAGGLDELIEPGFDLAKAAGEVQPGDLLTLVYTSGTTGQPKGVEITHANMVAMVQATAPLIGVRPGDRMISFLPSAHIADRWASHYLHLWCGTELTCLDDHRQIAAALVEVRPTLFGGVPQVWQRITGALRAKLGLDQVRVAVTAAAPTPPEVVEYVNAIGVPLVEAWGMSEVSGMGTMVPPGTVRSGTIGLPIAGPETRIEADGELLAVVAGDARPHLTALLVVDPEVAAASGFDVTDPAGLAANPKVRGVIQAGVAAANATLSRAEQIRAYEILPEIWLPGGDQVTPTMKVRRHAVLNAYATNIEALYAA